MSLFDTPALRLARADAPELAWRHRPAGPGRTTVVYLHGLGSDMAGDKARAIALWAERADAGLLALDYRGHGGSGGRFEDGGPGLWLRDTLDVLAAAGVTGPVRLVGSSIGGWVALLAARALGARCDGLVLIAAAPDITVQMQAGFTPAQHDGLARDGVAEVPTPWGPPFRISQSMLDDAAAHFVMRQPISIAAPVRLLHGQRDGEVPWRLSLAIAERLESEDVRVLLVKDGDHRLSRPDDLALLCEALASLETRRAASVA